MNMTCILSKWKGLSHKVKQNLHNCRTLLWYKLALLSLFEWRWERERQITVNFKTSVWCLLNSSLTCCLFRPLRCLVGEWGFVWMFCLLMCCGVGNPNLMNERMYRTATTSGLYSTVQYVHSTITCVNYAWNTLDLRINTGVSMRF